jgi:4-azaleucine resistance transporter AzlC
MARMSASPSSPNASDRSPSGFVRGMKLGAPVLLGYIPIAIAFGVLARTAGLTVFQTIVCSMLVFAGSGQFIAIAMIGAGANAPSILITTAVLNLRHILFGATLQPYLRHVPLGRQALIAAGVTDESFAVNITDLRGGSASASSVAGVEFISWTGWQIGTIVGAVATSFVGDPSRWGLGFAMAAMFTALLVAQAEDRRHVVVAVIACALAAAFMLFLPSQWSIVATAVIAAAIGAVVFR